MKRYSGIVMAALAIARLASTVPLYADAPGAEPTEIRWVVVTGPVRIVTLEGVRQGGQSTLGGGRFGKIELSNP